MSVHPLRPTKAADPLQSGLAIIRAHKSPADTQRFILNTPPEFITALAMEPNPALSTRQGVLNYFNSLGCPIDGSSANQLAIAIDTKRKRPSGRFG